MSTILSIDLPSTNPTMISSNTSDNNSSSYPFISLTAMLPKLYH